MATDPFELQQRTDQILAWKTNAQVAFHAIGTALIAIRDRELWRAGDYTSFTDYLNRGADLSRSSAYNLIDVAAHFSPEVATSHNQAALTAAIRYLNATGVTPSDDALSTLITIPDGTRDRQQPSARVTWDRGGNTRELHASTLLQ